MAINLIKAGYELTVYDINQSAVEEVAALGASKAASSKEVAEKSDVIITMLPNSPCESGGFGRERCFRRC